MLCNKNILHILIALLLYNLLFINNAFGVSLRLKENTFEPGTEPGGESNNPWEKYMSNMDVATAHQSGTMLDLNGRAVDKENNINYPFPVGRCPVFSKVLVIKKSADFLNPVPVDTLTEETFLSDTITGNVTGFVVGDKNAGLAFPSIKSGPYEDWISPVEKKNVFECAKYVSQFEHFVEAYDQNENCAAPGNVGNCIKQPFVYNFETKHCYIMYQVQQYKNDIKKDSLNYFYMKSAHHPFLAYGSTNLRKNWEEVCSVKPIKGAAFGVWQNNKCEKPPVHSSYPIKSDSTLCGHVKFEYYTVHWETYFGDSETCDFFEKKPDCLIYAKDAISFTSLGMTSTDIYDLPPCFEESNGWVIEANCVDGEEREYTCNGKQWEASDGTRISRCESQHKWANIGKLYKIEGEDAKKNGLPEREEAPPNEVIKNEEAPPNEVEREEVYEGEEYPETEEEVEHEYEEEALPPRRRRRAPKKASRKKKNRKTKAAKRRRRR